MTGKNPYLFLIEEVHASAFWDDVTDEFMVSFQLSLLVGNVRVAIKNFRTAFAFFIFLNSPWIFKFSTVICKYYREGLFEKPSA